MLNSILDNRLSVESQVTTVCRSCFYELRQLRVGAAVSDDRRSTSNRPDFHPLPFGLLQLSAHWGIAKGQMKQLQAVVQNAASCLVSAVAGRHFEVGLKGDKYNLDYKPLIGSEMI